MRGAFLVPALLAGFGACAAPSVASRHLPAGSKMLLTATPGAVWESSNPGVADIEWRATEAGRRQAWLIARTPGTAVLTPVRVGSARIVGPTEVILNQSDFNNRTVSPPPPRPPVIKVTVE